MTSSYVYLRPTRVVFVRETGRYSQSSQLAWKRMFDWLNTAALTEQPRRGYGLARDNPRLKPVEQCRYDACVEITDGMESRLPEGFNIQTLPGGPYVRKRHVGNHATLRDTIVEVREGWLPARGLAVDTRRPLVEVYLTDPRFVPADQMKTEICMPIQVDDSVGIKGAA